MADSGKQNPNISTTEGEGMGDQSKKLYRMAAMQRLRDKRAAAMATKIAAAGTKSETDGGASKDQRISKARKTSDVEEGPARRLAITENIRKEKKAKIKMEKQPLPGLPVVKKQPDEKGDGIMVSGSSSNGNTSRSSKHHQLLTPDLQGDPPAAQPRPLAASVQNRHNAPSQDYFLALPASSQIPLVLLPKEAGQPAPTTTLQLFPERPRPVPQHERCIPAYGRTPKRGVAITKADGQRVTGYILRCFTEQDIVISCDCHNRMYTPEGFMNHAGLKGLYNGSPLQHIKVLNKV